MSTVASDLAEIAPVEVVPMDAVPEDVATPETVAADVVPAEGTSDAPPQAPTSTVRISVVKNYKSQTGRSACIGHDAWTVGTFVYAKEWTVDGELAIRASLIEREGWNRLKVDRNRKINNLNLRCADFALMRMRRNAIVKTVDESTIEVSGFASEQTVKPEIAPTADAVVS